MATGKFMFWNFGIGVVTVALIWVNPLGIFPLLYLIGEVMGVAILITADIRERRRRRQEAR